MKPNTADETVPVRIVDAEKLPPNQLTINGRKKFITALEGAARWQVFSASTDPNRHRHRRRFGHEKCRATMSLEQRR